MMLIVMKVLELYPILFLMCLPHSHLQLSNLFAIVKSGLDQTSRCSRPAIVCLVQSAAAGFQKYIMCVWLVVYTEVIRILLNHRTIFVNKVILIKLL